MTRKTGKVYLVGAGPGDPELITKKALHLIGEGEIIFYDNLVNPRLLQMAPPKARLVDVGKRGEGTSADQKEIEDRIVAAARQGKTVVRLKGGDPFIFGRGGEEAERLALEKIPFEIIPGVTSPLAAPAYAGIPLTHRDFTHSVAFITGHAQEEGAGKRGVGTAEKSYVHHLPTLDWNAVAKMGTLVFLMGVKTIDQIMQRLLQAGREASNPVAVIRWGTYPKQQTILGTVETIAEEVKRRKLMPPAIIVVGEVVKLREKINWYETLPLFGKKILVSRARAQAGELCRRLEELGADVLEVPTIEIVPPSSWKKLDGALRHLQDYSWILFTSLNGVNFFFDRLKTLAKDIRELSGCRLGAVGPSTAAALEKFYLKVEMIPEEFTGKSLARAMPRRDVVGKKILIPRAKEGGEDLIRDLKEKGGRVEAVTAYETHASEIGKAQIAKIKDASAIDLLTFASSSSAKNFFDLLPDKNKKDFLNRPCLCIGPTTAKTASDLGFSQVLSSQKATLPSLVDAILGYFLGA